MRFLSVALVGALVSLPSGCSKPPTRSDVVGRWVADPASLHFLKPEVRQSACEITFRQDGSFSTPGLPDEVVGVDPSSGMLISGNGRWSLEFQDGNYNVDLVFDTTNGSNIRYQTNSLKISNGQLFFFIGDPDEYKRFDFVKQTKQ